MVCLDKLLDDLIHTNTLITSFFSIVPLKVTIHYAISRHVTFLTQTKTFVAVANINNNSDDDNNIRRVTEQQSICPALKILCRYLSAHLYHSIANISMQPARPLLQRQ